MSAVQPGAPAATDHLGVATSTGRVPLAYVRDGDTIWLVAQAGAARWAVEILRAGKASLSIEPGPTEWSCRLVTEGSDRQRVLEAFRRKYGPTLVARWFRPAGRVLELTPSVGPDRGASYFDWLEAEFDSIAEEYDHHILDNRVNRWLRDRSVDFLTGTFPASARLLEIGCGSGTETLRLLDRGHEILAVDISGRMLEVVQRKARARGRAEQLEVRKMRAGELERLRRDLGDGSFQGAFSTYGALNCEPDLRPLAPTLRALLRPDGRFVAGVFNRWCAFETGAYAFLFRWNRAWGRHGTPVAVETSRFCVDAFAYSVPEFRRLFHPYFTARRVEGVAVLVPPSDHDRRLLGFTERFDRLTAWDAAVGRRFPFSWLGDHFLIEMSPN